ncbi:HNH endonuclease signature motif containing protein [Segeticoccus rhizosphaerae]|uniref:HNH endonuclease signature motif containing protein n=1 Tax=Segeticoccus rhizosphaerae TaxID=1104777 RepID=UPI0010C11910|nr:HNH endonuclease signature motif containing protein [Ornithinicoccus soli]
MPPTSRRRQLRAGRVRWGPEGLPRVDAVEVAAARERLSRTAADLRTVAAGLWSVGSDDLAALISHLDVVRSGVDIATVLATRDAAQRGVVSESQQASEGQWLRAQVLRLEPAEAAAVGQVAKACTQQPRHQLLQSLVASGAATTKAAATALREVTKILPDLDLDVDYDEVLGWYLSALMGGATGADLRRLSDRLRQQYGSAEANQKGEKAHGLNALDVSTLPDGVRRYLIHLCPEYAAALDAALATLSAPQPGVDPDTGEQLRDERTPARRRAEALVEIVKRTAATDPSTSSTATTKLILTMSMADLLSGTGSATTREGELLDAGTARRLACDADVIPAVLGGGAEILDWGTEKRLFDGPLRAAIVARDRCCTFPGCGRPATWCQAHHLVHWIDGGRTALTNAALLCQRHHTIVHRDNLGASIVDHQVVWDTTPRAEPPTSDTGYPPQITTCPGQCDGRDERDERDERGEGDNGGGGPGPGGRGPRDNGGGGSRREGPGASSSSATVGSGWLYQPNVGARPDETEP